MTNFSTREEYLITRANIEGLKGNRVISIIEPDSASSTITDTVFIVEKYQLKSATELDIRL